MKKDGIECPDLVHKLFCGGVLSFFTADLEDVDCPFMINYGNIYSSEVFYNVVTTFENTFMQDTSFLFESDYIFAPYDNGALLLSSIARELGKYQRMIKFGSTRPEISRNKNLWIGSPMQSDQHVLIYMENIGDFSQVETVLNIISAYRAVPIGIITLFDQQTPFGNRRLLEAISERYRIEIHPLFTLNDLINYAQIRVLLDNPEFHKVYRTLLVYRDQYCIA